MSASPVDWQTRPTAAVDWHETALARLRAERDALRAGLAAQTLEPVPPPPPPAHQQRLRQYCRVQRDRLAGQRRAREDGA